RGTRRSHTTPAGPYRYGSAGALGGISTARSHRARPWSGALRPRTDAATTRRICRSPRRKYGIPHRGGRNVAHVIQDLGYSMTFVAFSRNSLAGTGSPKSMTLSHIIVKLISLP